MGTMHYTLGIASQFDDRTLAHLQSVIGIKLRRHESFFFSWKDLYVTGTGRQSIWVHSAMALAFQYTGTQPVKLNPEWIRILTDSANTAAGLQLLDEPGPPERTRPG